MNKIIYDFGIRVDEGYKVGSGHFFRCIAIAKELVRNKKKVIFLIKKNKKIESYLIDLKIPCKILRGENERENIIKIKKLSGKIKNLIIDLPKHNELYSRSFVNFCKTAIIDDLGNKKIFSELLINGQIVKKYHKYVRCGTTKFFLGPKYIILRNEFASNKHKVKIRQESIKKILLTFGGEDHQNITNKIYPFFLDKNYELTILIGSAYSNKNKLLNSLKHHSKIKIKKSVKNIDNLFSKQDLVIASAGITIYELACLGIPTIIISTANHGIALAQEFSKLGFGINYGMWDNDFKRLGEEILRLNDDKKKKNMFLSGRKLVDGKGCQRVVKHLLQMDSNKLK